MPSEKPVPSQRRPYQRPQVRSERFAERHAMACPKHLDTNTPRAGCAAGVGWNS